MTFPHIMKCQLTPLGGYVSPGVCLSVCLSVCSCMYRLHWSDHSDLHGNFTTEKYLWKGKTDWFLEVMQMQIWIQQFLKDSSTLRARVFCHNLANISGKTHRVVMKILSLTYLWTRKSSLYFLEDIQTRPDLPCRRSFVFFWSVFVILIKH